VLKIVCQTITRGDDALQRLVPKFVETLGKQKSEVQAITKEKVGFISKCTYFVQSVRLTTFIIYIVHCSIIFCIAL